MFYGMQLEWYFPERENFTKQEKPYAYSPFFTFGSHSTIAGASADYTDRYLSWGAEKFRAAQKVAGIKGDWWNTATPAQVQKFVTAYYGKGYKLVGIVEWCNVSSGYPHWSIHFTKPKPRKTTRKKTNEVA